MWRCITDDDVLDLMKIVVRMNFDVQDHSGRQKALDILQVSLVGADTFVATILDRRGPPDPGTMTVMKAAVNVWIRSFTAQGSR